MPRSSAESFIFLLEILICSREESVLTITVARITRIEGTTSAGANWKIWAMYIRDRRLESPVEKTVFRMVSLTVLTALIRLVISPVEYWRKKLTGRDRIRIMTEDSTATEVFVVIRFVRRVFIALTSLFAKAQVRRKTAMPVSMLMFLEERMGPVTRL